MPLRRSPRRPRVTAVVVLVLAVAALVVGLRATGVVGRPDADELVARARPGTALAVLGTLAVKGRAPKTGYSRAQFGEPWTDVDHNGCDTRDDVLARDLTAVSRRAGDRCEVAAGVLADPYRPHRVDFARGPDSAAVQIDHVVALSDVWQTGAYRWSTAARTAFANDPMNLLAVDGPLNEAKGDGDAATWLPPNKGFRCAYVARQVGVKAKYGAWVTPAERTAIARVLSGCREQPLPPGSSVVVLAAGPPSAAGTALRTPVPAPPASAPDAPAPVPAPRAAPPPAGVYSSCAAARAAGATPLHAGDPGYSRTLDRDGDGSACE